MTKEKRTCGGCGWGCASMVGKDREYWKQVRDNPKPGLESWFPEDFVEAMAEGKHWAPFGVDRTRRPRRKYSRPTIS